MPLLLFILIPVAEMWLLIEVGAKIGALYTIGLVLLTAMVGLSLLKRQGFSAITRANQKMQAGEMPVEEMIEGIFLAVGGALLLTPGFITDAIGFCCLLPGVRQLLLGRLVKRMVANGQGATFYSYGSNSHQSTRTSAVSNGVIEGEYERDSDAEPNKRIE